MVVCGRLPFPWEDMIAVLPNQLRPKPFLNQRLFGVMRVFAGPEKMVSSKGYPGAFLGVDVTLVSKQD